MNYAYEIRRQAEAAPRAALPAVASALWKAFGEGHLSEAEAEALSGLIEARQVRRCATDRAPVTANPPTSDSSLRSPRSRAGSRRARMPRWSAVAAGRPLGGFLRVLRHGSPWLSRRCLPWSRPRSRSGATAV